MEQRLLRGGVLLRTGVPTLTSIYNQWHTSDFRSMTAAERKRLTEQLRTAIEQSGLTRYELAKRSGVSQSMLSRFVNGQGSLALDSIEKLAPFLGIEITTKRRKK